VADRRDAVAFLRLKGVSERRACRLMRLGRSSLRYRPRGGRDEALRLQLREIARRHPRYGYRRAWAVLRREGWSVNLKRVHRVWKDLGLAVPRRHRRRRRRGGDHDPVPVRAERPGHVWTYDFLKDHCENGQALRILTVVDEFTRECLAIEVGGSFGARRVRAVLERLFAEHNPPEWLRSDNGPEFIALALKAWLAERGSRPRYIDPGCPWQNAYGESFNGKLRDECLNLELFASRGEAAVVLEAWRLDYNMQRPHSSLGYRTPREFRESLGAGGTGDPSNKK
jgi:putative transposase